MADIGIVGMAVMGQNLALNVASKGFKISVHSRTYSTTEAAVARAKKEGLGDKLMGYESVKEFVKSLAKPRAVIILVRAGAAVDAVIDSLAEHMDQGDIIIDGGNEWYENTEKRKALLSKKGLFYIGMGVSGGEEGARNGPSLMPGGSREAYLRVQPMLMKIAAQVDDGPCAMYIGPGGSGNFVKMVHNGIEYGDMQLISEAYDVLKNIGGLSQPELAKVFEAWNKGELESFLVEITAIIMAKTDTQEGKKGFLVDVILDKTGMKGTGKWTVQQAADLSVASPTITASLDGRFMSGLKDERVAASNFYKEIGMKDAPVVTANKSPMLAYVTGTVSASDGPSIDKNALIEDVRQALYASKICSYAQGMAIIKAKSMEQDWGIDMGALARIWKGGCIIRAGFLDHIKQAYERNRTLPNLLVDPEFGKAIASRVEAWRRVVSRAVGAGIAVPGMMASLAYFDTYRRSRLPANLVQAQRDFFGSHTYQRTDADGWFHTVWDETFGSADSITTTGYNN